MPVYVASIDVCPREGADIDGEGATVEVFIPADIAEEAVRKLLGALARDHYGLEAINSLREFDDLEWSSDEDTQAATQMKREAQTSDEVVYATFFCWDSEYEH